MAARSIDDLDVSEYVDRVAVASASGGGPALPRLLKELRGAANGTAPGTYERGAVEALIGVLRGVRREISGAPGLAPQSAALEPGSLSARMLLEVAGGVRGANADLAERLDTDQWQVSRAGRRLRLLGLADRQRDGRLNTWTLTKAGERTASHLRSKA